MMSKVKILLVSFAVTLAVWLCFSWPLPGHITSGIPSSGQNIEKGNTRRMVEGDQLQLLYHFWLFSDMLADRTDWFANPYEFNVGSDEGRTHVDAYYFPFSFVYAVFAAVGGRAFGWNAAGFVSLWLTYLATWLLLVRLTRDRVIGGVFALVSIIMPVRWMNLLGGSPTGFGMAWIPFVMLGIDIAVRSRRWSGGALAGIALLFACWTDLHVFYFSALLTPVWFVVCLFILPSDGATPETPREWLARLMVVARSMLPLAVSVLLIFVYVRIVNNHIGGSVMKGGRTLPEILLFSQSFSGLWSFGKASFSSWLYLGYGVLFVVSASTAVFFCGFRQWGGLEKRIGLLMLFLLAGVALIACLASGPLGPFGGGLFLAARKFIPSYEMIRQPGKVFSLMPTFLALLCGTSFAYAAGRVLSGRARRVLLCLLPLIFFLEYLPRVSATICELDFEQAAYASVAEDAEAAGEDPGALVLVLWPGDSHFTSVYQYYASLYHIRMVNGYSPSVGAEYIENVFKKFESMNQGYVDDAQLDALLEMNAGYILLHENMFPEKVSPFPVAFTLKRLLNHPRLELLEQDGSVWAFKILRQPRPGKEIFPQWNLFFPARIWPAGRLVCVGGRTVDEPGAVYGSYTRLDKGGSVSSPAVCLSPDEEPRWMARIRGSGRAAVSTMSSAGRSAGSVEFDVDSAEWVWIDAPVNLQAGCDSVVFNLSVASGRIDVDTALLSAGDWRPPEPGEKLSIPAPCFFHAGYTDVETGRVCLRADYDPEAIVFYGPKLPLPRGVYEFRLDFESDAPSGTELGAFNFRTVGDEESEWHPVIAGQAAAARWESDSKPVFLAFRFDRACDMYIISVEITGIEQ